MRRKLAFMLAVILSLSTVFTTYAAGGGNARTAKTGFFGTRSVQEKAVGQVDVSIGTALILEREAAFTVSLTGSGKENWIGVIKLKANTVEEKRISFENLADGDYNLEVSGQGFATYRQKIRVEGRACGISLTTGFLGGVNYTAGAAHPGVLLIGDVDGNELVNAADGAILVDRIEAAGRGENARLAGGTGDLNGDGVTDLVDLEYFARGYGMAGDTQASVEHFVPAAVISAGAPENTRVEGNLEAFLREKESVRLIPEAGSISEKNPVSLEFDFSGGSAAADNAVRADGILIRADEDNFITDAVVAVLYEGADKPMEIPVVYGVHHLLKNADVRVEQDEQGTIRLFLGSQIALKKVTLTIKGMAKNNNLAEISKVEFVNGMEERIPEPEKDIPTNLAASAGDKKISLKWSPCVNITGYEVKIRQGDRQETVFTAVNSLNITSFGGRELTNYLEYQISVQSVNGSWSSGYSEEVTAVPKPSGKPDRPDNVSAKGGYQRVDVSWKSMKDTVSYNLYYKESGSMQYQRIENIKESQYAITGLRDLTEYTVYVTAVNEFGESAPSLAAAASTTDLNPAVITKYNLINTGKEGEAGAHIINASMSASMIDSPLDTQAGTAWGTVDKDPASCYRMNSWDDGGFNNMSLRHGLTYEFDQAYKMDTIAFHDLTCQDTGYFYVKVRYWDENGKQENAQGVSLVRKKDEAGRIYYMIKLSQPVTAKKIQFGLARYSASGNITVSEVYFYYYDSLMEEIMGLYADDLHTVLKTEVTQTDIDKLRGRINTPDEVSGEYHPDRELLERELATAEAILHDGKLNGSVEIHNGITTNDVSRGFGGLNAWQPLGVVAAAQEEIMVYVGHNSRKTGDNSNLQLVATQYHAESGTFAKTIVNLKVGPNKVTVPKIWATTGVESGGALYVQYTGNSKNDRYAVRVSGGVQVPILDLYRVTDEAERLERTKTYVAELRDYVEQIADRHQAFHANSGNSQVAYAYDAKNCVLGATDILLDTMMISIPAQQVIAGAGSGSVEQQAGKILNSMKSMEDMMYLFYQHKGLNAGAGDALNQIPKGHLNIRYQRMFSGAFMYAAGNHIGIEWGSTSGLVTSVPVSADSEGRYQSGRYFGWGIAHEIGHCINQGAYAVAEITNNYFAVLAQAKDSNDSVRFQYDNVYKKVTSGAKGKAGNVFTQLGMYWQLHLAYDRGYNYKTYEKYDEQLQNLFFARVDTYARKAAAAPKPGNVALTLSGNKDQDLMRLCCAAAERNILEFFERWGMTPDAATRSYAEQFAPETRAIYYVNDESRVYSLKGKGSTLGTEGKTEAVGNVTVVVNDQRASQVDFTLSSTLPQGDVLGYEIVRCMISGGDVQKDTVGFVTGSTFSDTVTINNRMVWYEITVIDKYLNRSAAKALEPIKIENDGSLEKSFWTVTTQKLTVDETMPGTGDEYTPCEPEKEDPAYRMIDDQTTAYQAVAEGDAEILLEMNKTNVVSGFRYTGLETGAGTYEIQIRSGGKWIKVAEGALGQGTAKLLYFANEDGKYVSTYETDAVKLILKVGRGSRISVEELDVLGVTGDNVDFRRTTEGTSAIGTLKADYRYGTEEKDVIPAGSILFTGAYKGNPAYNVVMLYDQDGNIVGGVNDEGELKAQQVILADVPAEGNIQNVSDGTWIYWIEPDQKVDLSGITRVRAELYRVNSALTNEGQRLVSDSLFEAMPAELPGIQIHPGAQP